ncbi:DUF6519 domain-containing protein [Enterovibrio norvegicus]|uniref:DUF6519 domain-containing protein n=1 Tax=Enterovibrio norvegicus TaxID=188144 RepID=UPI0035541066
MAVDISGKTFDPRHNYSELVSMQGRVVSDAPLNEGAAMVDRRFRAETIDLAGFCGYPAHLPDSFRISVIAGQLAIHPGRYYVDGLLAENFGSGVPDFYHPLEELHSNEPYLFHEQPYRPLLASIEQASNELLGDEPEDGRYLVYLEVWKRPITFLEAPDLIDPAIGVDTTARMQTVWQVRRFGPVSDDVTCATDDQDIPNWDDVTAPSSARLSTRANPASAVDDPCLLPPEGGYRGLENRTYMVSVHDVLADGRPLIKWSRVHAAFAARILSQPASNTLTMDQVAKDDYLRFNAGDWVEITDDVRVLEGIPGSIVRVLSVTDATNTLVLENPLAAGDLLLVPASTVANQSIHPIVRRWDQSGVVLDTDGNQIVNLDSPASDGLIPISAEGTFIALEDGVEVALSRHGGAGSYHPGDHWTFVTRYADSSVETLTDAPPHGTHHHFCRLAVVDALNGEFVDPVFQDCRDPIGMTGCCTVVVRPGENIQAAIDSLSIEFGGCVCLKTGVHDIFRAIHIRHSNVTLHGECHGAQIRHLGGESAIVVQSDNNDIISGIHLTTLDIRVAAPSEKPQGIIAMLGVEDSLIEDCHISSQTGRESQTHNPAIGLFNCSHVRVLNNITNNTIIGVWLDEGGEDLLVEGNVMDASDLVGDNGNDDVSTIVESGLIGVGVGQLSGAAIVTKNDIRGYRRGVVVNNSPMGRKYSTAANSQVTDNRITIEHHFEDDESIAVELNCAFGVVSRNEISIGAGNGVGISVTGLGCLIERNRLQGLSGRALTHAGATDGAALLAIKVGDDEEVFTGGVTITQNWIQGFIGGVAADQVSALRVLNNIFEGQAGDEVGVTASECIGVNIEGNTFTQCSISVFGSQCEDIQVQTNHITEGGAAIMCERCVRLDVLNNHINNCSHGGIVVVLCVMRAAIIGNRLNYIGVQGDGMFASSIVCVFHLGESHIESNEVLNTGVNKDGEVNAERTIGIGAVFVLEARVESNLVSYSDLLTRERIEDDRALLMQGLVEWAFFFGDSALRIGYSAQINNNKFLGRGSDTVVEILSRSIIDNLNIRFERVFFSNNYVEHVGFVGDDVGRNATVVLSGFRASVMGNQVKAQTRFLPSFDFNNMQGPFIGNITTGRVEGHNEFPVPENAFNQQV